MRGPLLTREVCEALGRGEAEVSLDLGRTTTKVLPGPGFLEFGNHRFPLPQRCKDRTIYWWNGEAFEPVQRYSGSLIKLVPTKWGAPVFEIDGIKMLVSENLSPWEDARRKVALIEPRGKAILDCCGGLGYFAAHCLEGGAREVRSFEKNPDVVWLRGLNPWSPAESEAFSLALGSIEEKVQEIADASFDAVLHDPPRFGIAGELYALSFYRQLFRVLKRKGRLFHYTGAPNRLTSGRDVQGEVLKRLREAGFAAERVGDGVLARS